jgi:hypothetical protein
MDSQMIVRIDPELKDRLNRLARSEGKTASGVVRELIGGYLKDRDIGAYIDGLWKRIGARLASRGAGPGDVARAVAEARNKRP